MVKVRVQYIYIYNVNITLMRHRRLNTDETPDEASYTVQLWLGLGCSILPISLLSNESCFTEKLYTYELPCPSSDGGVSRYQR